MGAGTCRNGDVEIAFETFGPPDGRPLLLIMAAAMPMGFWHDEFCAALADRGFQVARFDNRDAGQSTHLEAGTKYSLADMADDTVAVLDALGWADAHLVGVSLGGMIGQVLAVRHAARVRSLTSISSGPSHRFRVVRPKLGALLKIIVSSRRSARGAPGDDLVDLHRITGSPAYPIDEDWLRAFAAPSGGDNGSGVAASQRQLAAMRRSGDRRAELSRVRVPVLVLHGEADPIQSLHAGRTTAAAIAGARFVSYPGMGHDLPRALWATIIDEICALAARADTTDQVGESR